MFLGVLAENVVVAIDDRQRSRGLEENCLIVAQVESPWTRRHLCRCPFSGCYYCCCPIPPHFLPHLSSTFISLPLLVLLLPLPQLLAGVAAAAHCDEPPTVEVVRREFGNVAIHAVLVREQQWFHARAQKAHKGGGTEPSL